MAPSYRAQVVVTNHVEGIGWLTVVGGIVTDDPGDKRLTYTLQDWVSRLDELDWRSPVLLFREVLALVDKLSSVLSYIFDEHYDEEPSTSVSPTGDVDLSRAWTEGLKGVDLNPGGDVDATGG